MKKLFKSIYSNSFLRDFLNISWSPYYDITFHDIAKDLKEAKYKIDNHPKFRNLEDTYSLIEEEIKNVKDIKIDPNLQNAFIPILISIFNQSENKIESILDVGGGINPVSLYVKKYCNIEIQSSVIETAAYTNKLNDLISRDHDFIKYFADLNALDNLNFDLIYFGSVIQYLEDKEYDVIEKTISFNPKLIVISHTMFIDQDEDLYSLQSVGRKHLMPYKFFSYKKMINFFKKEKYKLIIDIDLANIFIHKKIDNKNFKNKSLIFIKEI